MNRQLKRQSGVTLIELLIAVTLVSFICLGILIAMRVGLNAMEKVNNKVISNRRVMSVERAIQEEIEDIVPVVADCRPGGDDNKGKISFFQGRPDSMRFVSTYSLEEASRGRAHIVAYQVIRGEDGVGVRLIVNEQIYAGPLFAGTQCSGVVPDPESNQGLAQFAPIEAGPASFVLADKLAYCRISYRDVRPPPELERWTPVWHFNDHLPTAIRIDMAPLVADPSKLQVMTVTAPVHVTKWVLGPYVD